MNKLEKTTEKDLFQESEEQKSDAYFENSNPSIYYENGLARFLPMERKSANHSGQDAQALDQESTQWMSSSVSLWNKYD